MTILKYLSVTQVTPGTRNIRTIFVRYRFLCTRIFSTKKTHIFRI